jgi:hypothetical protein
MLGEQIMLVVLKNEIVAVVTCKVSGPLSRHLAYVLAVPKMLLPWFPFFTQK